MNINPMYVFALCVIALVLTFIGTPLYTLVMSIANVLSPLGV